MSKYIYQDQEGLKYLCDLYKDGYISGKHIIILNYMISNIKNGSNFYFSNKQISVDLNLNIDSKHVSTFIKRLIEFELVFHGTTLDINAPYVLHPMLGYKGELDTIDEVLNKINNKRGYKQ